MSVQLGSLVERVAGLVQADINFGSMSLMKQSEQLFAIGELSLQFVLDLVTSRTCLLLQASSWRRRSQKKTSRTWNAAHVTFSRNTLTLTLMTSSPALLRMRMCECWTVRSDARLGCRQLLT